MRTPDFIGIGRRIQTLLNRLKKMEQNGRQNTGQGNIDGENPEIEERTYTAGFLLGELPILLSILNDKDP